MKIDKERSLKFVSIKEKGNMNLNPALNNVNLSPLFELLLKDVKRDKVRVFIAKQKANYFKNVQDADMSQFDLNFVELYRDGTIEILPRSKKYKVGDLYINVGVQNNQNRIHVESFLEKGIDAFSGEKIENFERTGLMPLKDSTSFFEIYDLCRQHSLYEEKKIIITNDILEDVYEIFSRYDEKRHDRVPETYYYYQTAK